MTNRPSLRKHLTLQFVAVAVVPLLLISWISLHLMDKSLQREISSKNQSIARALAGEVGRFLEAPLALLNHVADMQLRQDPGSPEELDMHLRDLVDHYPFLEMIQILDTEGFVTHAAPRESNQLMLDMSSEPMFVGARISGSPFWSASSISPLSGHPTVSLSVPFRDGVVVGHLTLATLGDMTDRLNTGGNGRASITDQRGTLIAHSRADYVLQRVNVSNLKTVQEGLAGGEGTLEDEIDGQRYLGSVARVPKIGWLALYLQPRDVAFAPLAEIRILVAAGLFLTTVATLILALLGLRRTLHPLGALVSTVRQITDGRFSRFTYPASYREIDMLGENFNRMSEALESREKALQESERRLRRFHNATLEGILVSVDGLIVDANQRLSDMLGYEPGELTGTEVMHILADEDRPMVKERMKSEQTEPYRIRAVRKDGTNIYVEAVDRETEFYGKPARIHCIYDITTLVRVEQSLQATMKINADILEKAPFGIFLVDPKGFIDYVNPAMCSISGVECREFVGINVFEVPTYRNLGLDEKIRGLFAGTPFVYGPLEYTSSLREKTTSRIFSGIPFGDDDDRRALVFVEDVTEIKRMEQVIARAKDEWESTFDSVQDLVMIVGLDKRVMRANRALASNVGLGTTDIAGKTCHEILSCTGGEEACIHQRAIESRESRTEEMFDPRSASHFLVTAYPFLTKSGRMEGVVHVARNITERKRAEKALENAFSSIRDLKDQLEMENLILKEEVRKEIHHEEIVGRSEPMQKVLRLVEQVGPTDSTVLITGETGTGKELIARAIHRTSRRKSKLMVSVNCAALPATLIESELFGREKGAYTGALSRQAGRFELADKSTIFLDEIAELPKDLQSKLLRVLQEGEFERLGSSETLHVDVRVVAATNKDLAAEVKKGNFREDLFYRLNVFPLPVPPLRDRPGDIIHLVRLFVSEFAARTGRRIENIPKATMKVLAEYSWPGNVRELRNVIERAVILSTGNSLVVELPGIQKGSPSRPLTLDEAQRRHIIDTLRRTGWRVSGKDGAAELLDVKPTTLQSRMQKLGISREPGK